jgi:hypothetical protein
MPVLPEAEAAVVVSPPGDRSASRTVSVRPMKVVFGVLMVVALAYGIGLAADMTLNDDPCAGINASETDEIHTTDHWLPVRTDCEATTETGEVEALRGDGEVFWAMFLLTLVAAGALALRQIRLWLRLCVIAVGFLAAMVWIFVA